MPVRAFLFSRWCVAASQSVQNMSCSIKAIRIPGRRGELALRSEKLLQGPALSESWISAIAILVVEQQNRSILKTFAAMQAFEDLECRLVQIAVKMHDRRFRVGRGF